ncbi:hypothetical protein BC629DRAFT_1461864 [Irpex lacteus]|nr:hypothetical protein BC629DRAFT_1461864 [Irpex lacteus]
MHPWHWHWHRPSRLLWFMLGAVTGAWAMKHKEGADNYRVRHCSRYQIPQEAYPPPQGSANANAPSTREDWHAQWHARWRERERQWGWGPHHHPAQEAPTPVAESTTTPATTAATPTTTTAVASPVTPGPTPGIPDLPTTADGWEEERQRLLNIKQQAANSLLDFSEEGLDSLLTSMESLKARLSERRAQRDLEARERAEREADFRQFEEWKRERAVAALKEGSAKEGGKEKEPPKRLV